MGRENPRNEMSHTISPWLNPIDSRGDEVIATIMADFHVCVII